MTLDPTLSDPVAPTQEIQRDLVFYLNEIAVDAACVLLWLSNNVDDVGTDVITDKLSTLAMEASYVQFLWNRLPETETSAD